MRRISSKNAEPGMALGSSVYDNGGYLLSGAELCPDSLNTLDIYGVGEILIKDPRVANVAYCGELFDPELVKLFTRLAPLYPTGTTVKLNRGEVGIISDSNVGHIARPTVRVCAMGRSLRKPCNINLSEPRYQDRLVIEVDPYLAFPEE